MHPCNSVMRASWHSAILWAPLGYAPLFDRGIGCVTFTSRDLRRRSRPRSSSGLLEAGLPLYPIAYLDLGLGCWLFLQVLSMSVHVELQRRAGLPLYGERGCKMAPLSLLSSQLRGWVAASVKNYHDLWLL